MSLSEKLSDSDANLCYPYWPMAEGEKMEIDGNRFVIECQKKTDFKGYIIYDLRLASTDPSVDITSGGSRSVHVLFILLCAFLRFNKKKKKLIVFQQKFYRRSQHNRQKRRHPKRRKRDL